MPNYTYTGALDSAVKNKLGAATHDELEKREAAFVGARDYEIASGYGPKGQFDANHLKAIHRHLFQDVFEWAGCTRDEPVQLSDGTVASERVMRKAGGGEFLPGENIPAALDQVAAQLHAANGLRDLSRAAFTERAADVMAEINGIHAFREGNGRTQRTFMRELAKQAGQELDFSVVTRERMIQASIAANERDDNSMMRRMFAEISNPARVAALAKALDDLGRHNFPWNDTYIATAEPGHKLDVTMAGIAGEQFMARTAAAVLIGQTADLPKPHPARNEAFTFEPGSWGREPPHDRPRSRGRGGR